MGGERTRAQRGSKKKIFVLSTKEQNVIKADEQTFDYIVNRITRINPLSWSCPMITERST